jgi:hypothetical protein
MLFGIPGQSALSGRAKFADDRLRFNKKPVHLGNEPANGLFLRVNTGDL